jgi:hypothetical protein
MPLSDVPRKAALLLTLASIGVGTTAGCVATNLPSAARVASSESAIRNARELGAERIPDAAAHLELAQRQLDLARRDIATGDTQAGRWMLVRADADAHLALALTREARSMEAAEEMAARVRELSTSLHASPDSL